MLSAFLEKVKQKYLLIIFCSTTYEDTEVCSLDGKHLHCPYHCLQHDPNIGPSDGCRVATCPLGGVFGGLWAARTLSHPIPQEVK